MGVTDSKKIQSSIDHKFKSIRKYYDQFYGEITVLEDKKSKMQYALIEKMFHNCENDLLGYL
jgi:hypothetical protein